MLEKAFKGEIVLKRNVLITGVAGFIGANLALNLIKSGKSENIFGIDNLIKYYDVSLKKYRLNQIENACKNSPVNWHFIKEDIADKNFIDKLFAENEFEVAVNLAAQAEVR